MNIGRNIAPNETQPEVEDLEPLVPLNYHTTFIFKDFWMLFEPTFIRKRVIWTRSSKYIWKSFLIRQKNRLEESLDELRSKYKEQLPSNEQLYTFIQSEHTFEIGEWLDLYDSTIDITLERGNICMKS